MKALEKFHFEEKLPGVLHPGSKEYNHLLILRLTYYTENNLWLFIKKL